jgi:hypothetical protein
VNFSRFVYHCAEITVSNLVGLQVAGGGQAALPGTDNSVYRTRQYQSDNNNNNYGSLFHICFPSI